MTLETNWTRLRECKLVKRIDMETVHPSDLDESVETRNTNESFRTAKVPMVNKCLFSENLLIVSTSGFNTMG